MENTLTLQGFGPYRTQKIDRCTTDQMQIELLVFERRKHFVTIGRNDHVCDSWVSTQQISNEICKSHARARDQNGRDTLTLFAHALSPRTYAQYQRGETGSDGPSPPHQRGLIFCVRTYVQRRLCVYLSRKTL